MIPAALDEICDLCNNYEIYPSKAIKLYNRAINKGYVKNEDEAMQLLNRYVSKHFKPRTQYIEEWQPLVIVDFQKVKKQWINED